MSIPDGTRAPISPGHFTTAEKSFGEWSTIDGDDSKHIEENVTGKTKNWMNRMRNAHLPARMGTSSNYVQESDVSPHEPSH